VNRGCCSDRNRAWAVRTPEWFSSREYPANADIQGNPPAFTRRSDLPQQFMMVQAHSAFSPFQADDASSILVGRSLRSCCSAPRRCLCIVGRVVLPIPRLSRGSYFAIASEFTVPDDAVGKRLFSGWGKHLVNFGSLDPLRQGCRRANSARSVLRLQVRRTSLPKDRRSHPG
jgi:hypothetical protein